jgi:hypothetical protein
MDETASTVEVLNSRRAQSICSVSSCRFGEGLDFFAIFVYDINILVTRYLVLRYWRHKNYNTVIRGIGKG